MTTDWKKPWLNEDGSTDTDGFLRAYSVDGNVFWDADQGHVMNVMDDLIDMAKATPINIRDVYSGSGRVTQVFIHNVCVWTWAWHIDGIPAAETTDLLRALGWKE